MRPFSQPLERFINQSVDRLWPSCGRGMILVTCRGELKEASATTHSIEVTPFSKNEGGFLLRQKIGVENSTNEEVQLALDFSETLGGHALTLEVIARHMRARKKHLADFVTMYKNNPCNLHEKPGRDIGNRYYTRADDLESLWIIAFDQLEPLEEQVFGILCMYGPNSLPAAVFHVNHSLVSIPVLDGIE